MSPSRRVDAKIPYGGRGVAQEHVVEKWDKEYYRKAEVETIEEVIPLE
jgi:hypothetical protein